MTLNELGSYLLTHGLALLVGGLVLFGLYRLAESLVHRVVTGLLHVQQATLAGGPVPATEVEKRGATLEDVLTRLIRAGFVLAVALLVLSVFDLWSLVAGLGLIAAAITLAGQAIVMDYLMGILILIEGPFYVGDSISVLVPGGVVEGDVEEVGLRRTVIRDSLGSMHAVSNGLIRQSSNLTRVYSVAAVDVQILRPTELDRAIAVAGRVGREIVDDPEFAGQLFDTPVETAVLALTVDGAAIRLRRRVPPSLRGRVTSELRRRLAAALAAEKIDIAR
jgi:small-conductance mechanosensitive channel